jgi:hypothetical protein
MRKFPIVAVLVLAAAGTSLAGSTVFSDDFNAETAGLNGDPSQWTVGPGTIDLIGDTTIYAWMPAGHGLYVDLDGTRDGPGTMTTDVSFTLLPGITYTLKFDLAGNQGPHNQTPASETDTVEFGFGGVTLGSYVIDKDQDWVTYDVTLSNGGSSPVDIGPLWFRNLEDSDDQGVLLDNVLLTMVPAPGAIVLGSLGLGLVGWLRRRRSL